MLYHGNWGWDPSLNFTVTLVLPYIFAVTSVPPVVSCASDQLCCSLESVFMIAVLLPALGEGCISGKIETQLERISQHVKDFQMQH